MTLLLFDIDGTLIRVNSSGRRAVRHALEQTFSRSLDVDSISFSGKTDPQILTEILDHNDLSPADHDSRFDQVLENYAQHFVKRVEPEDIDLLPGVRELLDLLKTREDITLGLVTGNLETTAYHKLESVTLDEHFTFGAFGSDHHDRHELSPLALERARSATGYPFEGHQTVVIGDTPHDVTCGRVIGARTVAVCTGRISRGKLSAVNPDLLFDDLTEYQPFIETILSSPPRHSNLRND